MRKQSTARPAPTASLTLANEQSVSLRRYSGEGWKVTGPLALVGKFKANTHKAALIAELEAWAATNPATWAK